MTERVWVVVPEPQVMEQGLQSDQVETLQLTGQGWVLQARVLRRFGSHALPLLDAGVATTRWLVC